MPYRNITVEFSEGIATVAISRPKALNALNSATLAELGQAVQEAEDNGEIEALIVTGAGEKAFVAGADIEEMSGKSPLAGRDFAISGQKLFARIENLGKPVIAAVNGYALGGGCELCMACDIRVASENAKFGQPEVGLGIIPGFGGTQRLPRLVGPGMARYLILTGEVISAAEALRIGLVERVTPPERLMETARAVARRVMAKAPVSVRMAKLAIARGLDMDLASGTAYEAEAFAVSFASSDRVEGMKAFLEKREASFRGE